MAATRNVDTRKAMFFASNVFRTTALQNCPNFATGCYYQQNDGKVFCASSATTEFIEVLKTFFGIISKSLFKSGH